MRDMTRAHETRPRLGAQADEPPAGLTAHAAAQVQAPVAAPGAAPASPMRGSSDQSPYVTRALNGYNGYHGAHSAHAKAGAPPPAPRSYEPPVTAVAATAGAAATGAATGATRHRQRPLLGISGFGSSAMAGSPQATGFGSSGAEGAAGASRPRGLASSVAALGSPEVCGRRASKGRET